MILENYARMDVAQLDLQKTSQEMLILMEDTGSLCLHVREASEDAGSGNAVGLKQCLDDGIEVAESIIRLVTEQRNRMEIIRSSIPC